MCCRVNAAEQRRHATEASSQNSGTSCKTILSSLVYVPAEEYKPGKVDAAETKLNPLTALPGAKEAIQTCSLPSVPFV